MNSKTVVITGANSGIGKAAALELARRGAGVVMTARSSERGTRARDEIRERSGNPNVELELGDFAKLEEVRALAQRLLERCERIDVLVNNAGVIMGDRRVTGDGLEATFQVNHLAPFLLTSLLLDRLRASAPARVVTVSSGAHSYGGPLDFDDLQAEKSYSAMPVYGRSKLCNILFTRSLARRLDGTGVTANCLHPGVVATGFAQDGDTNPFFHWGMKIASPFLLSPARGAKTTVYLASSPEVEGITGGYFARCKPRRPKSFARDDAAAERLWKVSVEMVGVSGTGA